MKRLFALGVALIISGCTVLQPLFTKKDLVEPEGITGRWSALGAVGKEQIWTIEKTDTVGYIVRNPAQPVTPYYAVFGKLDGKLFAEVRIIKPVNYYNSDSIILSRDRMVGKVHLTDSVMSFSMLDTEYLIEKSEAEGLDIEYEKHTDQSSDYNTGTSYILSEPTKKLQALILKYYDDSEALAKSMTMAFKKI